VQQQLAGDQVRSAAQAAHTPDADLAVS
jgi:hypothetical protein